MGEFTHVERDGALTVATIDRPEVMNALHRPAHIELEAIWDHFASDPEQRVRPMTHAGEAFRSNDCALDQ